MAESKRRGEKAVDERLDDDEVFDSVDDDATDEADDFEDELDDDTDAPPSRGSRAATKAAATAKGAKSAKAGKVDTTSGGGGGRIARFIREIVAELRKVNWPSRKELITYTIVVLVFVTVISSLVFGLDYGFAWLVSHSFAGK